MLKRIIFILVLVVLLIEFYQVVGSTYLMSKSSLNDELTQIYETKRMQENGSVALFNYENGESPALITFYIAEEVNNIAFDVLILTNTKKLLKKASETTEGIGIHNNYTFSILTDKSGINYLKRNYSDMFMGSCIEQNIFYKFNGSEMKPVMSYEKLFSYKPDQDIDDYSVDKITYKKSDEIISNTEYEAFIKGLSNEYIVANSEAGVITFSSSD